MILKVHGNGKKSQLLVKKVHFYRATHLQASDMI